MGKRQNGWWWVGTARDGGLCRTARQTTGKRRCNFSLGQRQSCSRLRAILQLLKGGESKVGAESREEFLGRRRGRQVPTWVEKEPPWWWCASLPAAGGAGSTNNYLTISDPGNKQSLASTTTTNRNDNYKKQDLKKDLKICCNWSDTRLETENLKSAHYLTDDAFHRSSSPYIPPGCLS